MVLHDKNLAELGKIFEEITTRTPIWLQCDYCKKEFKRDKKVRKKLNSIIDKDSCGTKSCTSQKRKEISLKLYGTEYSAQNKLVKEKIKKTFVDKYGTESYLQSEKFKQKRKEKILNKFGTLDLINSEKALKSIELKYGTKNAIKNETIKEKRRLNNRKKYGVNNPMQLDKCKQKKQDTSLTKYGFDNYRKTQECADKIKSTSLSKYGTEHPWQVLEIRDKIRRTCLSRYGFENPSQNETIKIKTKQTCIERYGVPNPLCLQTNRIYGKEQSSIAEWFAQYGITMTSNYDILNGKEIDLYNKNHQIAVEYNGLFWHTEDSPQPRERCYHYDKYLKCCEKNIRLITIFSDEWTCRNQQCKNFLKSIVGIFDKKYFARKCLIKPISKIDCQNFCEQHHIQGKNNNLVVCAFGLFHEEKLLGVMSLGRHHRNSTQCVLDRLCFADGVQVVGGASRLFAACLAWAKDNKIKEIISWSDNRWSVGSVYRKLGFVLAEELKPDYSYVDLKRPHRRISKQSQQKKKTGCPQGMTELEWANQRGLSRIWDCGKKRWLYNI